MTSKFTCINCRVAFSDADIQRQHYKTDWHRYNLKRKVAEIPPVSAEEFQRKVQLQREEDANLGKDNSVYCKVCHKTFTSPKSFENHMKSKKHLSLVENLHLPIEDIGTQATSSIVSTINSDTSQKLLRESMSDDDSEAEEVDSDEWDEEYSDSNPILSNNCLFCSHHSATMTRNLNHMMVAHSFFIPDIEYVTNIRGLLCYLGEKIVQGYMCLWCNDRGKSFHTGEAAQQHMLDKGHCKMLHEGETLLEYADFYNYSTSYPENSQTTTDEEVFIPILEDSDYQLVLPSGNVIGHRSLLRYYRQNFDPNRAVIPFQKKVHRVIAQYHALGWKEADKQVIAKKARDLNFMKRVQSKYHMQLGTKANNLSIKRPQVNF